MTADTRVLAALAGAPTSVRRRALNRGLLRLPPAPRRRAQYLLAHDRPLHLRRPRRWTEKVNWRMVFDRRELIAMTCDKLASKDWVERTAPGVVAIPQTVWSGDDPAALADVEWPERWVLKPNHGTGLVQLGGGRPDRQRAAELTALTRRWLVEPGPERWGEWGYGQARRRVVLEQAVPGTPAHGRTDYKFFVAGGAVRLAFVESSRFERRPVKTFHHVDGTPVATTAASPEPVPPQWDVLVEAARTLGAPFDAIRVDLYLEAGVPWFGELTAYDGGGLLHFPTAALDRALGASWVLPDLAAEPVADLAAEPATDPAAVSSPARP